MATLYFNPNEVANFSSTINNLFKDLKTSFTSIGKNMNDIANSKWKGSAAKKNLDSLDKAQTSLADFINQFNQALAECIKEAKSKINQLETTNLGQSLNFTVQEADKINVDNLKPIDTSVVEYDYAQIMATSESIKSIYNTISACKDDVPKQIRSFVGGDAGTAWRGNAADEFQNTIINAFNKISTPIDNLKTCVDNIREAAENAQRADQ